MDPGLRSHGMKANPPGYLWSKYECFLICGWWDILHSSCLHVKLWSNSTNRTEVRTNKQTYERKDENYIPLGINAGGIKTKNIKIWITSLGRRGPRMGPILENVSYLQHSNLIQCNYLTNKHSHFKEMRSWNTQNHNWKLKMVKRIWIFDTRRAYWPLLCPYQKLMQHTHIPWNVKLL